MLSDLQVRPASPRSLSAANVEIAAPSFGSVAADIIAEDLIAGFRAWRIWTVMGWDDIRQRYRRSVIGPFWITLSMGVFILLLGVIYSRLFNTPLEHYLPYLTVGYIVWGFISSTTTEACNAFHESGRIIKQIKLPYSIYVMRVIWRNFIVFLHTVVIYIPIAIFFKVSVGPVTLLALPALLLVVLNQTWLAVVIGILSTRYRDMRANRRYADPAHDVCHTDHVDARPHQQPASGRRCQSRLPFDRDRPGASAGYGPATAVMGRHYRHDLHWLGYRGGAACAHCATNRLLALMQS